MDDIKLSSEGESTRKVEFLDFVSRFFSRLRAVRFRPLLRLILTPWRNFDLVKQFILISSTVVLLGTVTIGLWVSEKIKRGVTQYSAATAAYYVDGLISPLVQELEHGEELSKENADKIRSIVESKGHKNHEVLAVKIWKKGGVIAYSTWSDQIGKKYEPTNNLQRAWKGLVSVEYDHVTHEDGSVERSEGKRLIEIYAPIFSDMTGMIIAVSEFYVSAETLGEELTAVTAQTWLVVGATTAAIVFALFSLIVGANRTIERQISAHKNLADQNIQLRDSVQRAYMRSATINERLLRRLGSDLHDGPAQLLGFALLRLDSVFNNNSPSRKSDKKAAKTNGDVELVRDALKDAMQEIRNLSSGFALPHLEGMDLSEVVHLIIRDHEKRTGTEVGLKFATQMKLVPNSLKECVYRFLQEALNNSFRHAEGKEQKVYVFDHADHLVVKAQDGGPGYLASEPPSIEQGLGLVGLKDRVEALGGKLIVKSVDGMGTSLTAIFDPRQIEDQEQINA